MITRETLKKLHELTAKVAELKELASENLKTAQDRFNHRTHKLVREGKEIELTEKVLWDEVFYVGKASQAGEILKTVHPEVFNMYDEQEKAAEELKKFAIVEMGMNMQALTLSDYLQATESLFELMLEERGLNNLEATVNFKVSEPTEEELQKMQDDPNTELLEVTAVKKEEE